MVADFIADLHRQADDPPEPGLGPLYSQPKQVFRVPTPLSCRVADLKLAILCLFNFASLLDSLQGSCLFTSSSKDKPLQPEWSLEDDGIPALSSIILDVLS